MIILAEVLSDILLILKLESRCDCMSKENLQYYWEEERRSGATSKDRIGGSLKKKKAVGKRVQPAVAVVGVNVQQVGDTIVVKANMPGFSSNEIHFQIKNGVVQIAGYTEKKDVEKGKDFYREEYSSSEVSKQFSIPKDVDTRHVEVKRKPGFLEIFIRKKKRVVKD